MVGWNLELWAPKNKHCGSGPSRLQEDSANSSFLFQQSGQCSCFVVPGAQNGIKRKRPFLFVFNMHSWWYPIHISLAHHTLPIITKGMLTHIKGQSLAVNSLWLFKSAVQPQSKGSKFRVPPQQTIQQACTHYATRYEVTSRLRSSHT